MRIYSGVGDGSGDGLLHSPFGMWLECKIWYIYPFHEIQSCITTVLQCCDGMLMFI